MHRADHYNSTFVTLLSTPNARESMSYFALFPLFFSLSLSISLSLYSNHSRCPFLFFAHSLFLSLFPLPLIVLSLEAFFVVENSFWLAVDLTLNTTYLSMFVICLPFVNCLLSKQLVTFRRENEPVINQSPQQSIWAKWNDCFVWLSTFCCAFNPFRKINDNTWRCHRLDL